MRWNSGESFLFPLLFALFGLFLLAGCADVEDRKAKYFKSGMELYEEGNYEKARLEFKNVLQIDPKDVEALYMFGQIEEKDQNWRKSYALFLRAVELNPLHVGAQVHLGRLYALSGAPEKALDAADAALKVSPDDPGALVLRGLAKARLGEQEEAIKQALAAVKVAPENLDAISLLSALYADQGELDKAISLVREGLDKNPDKIVAYLLLARLYEKAGNTEGTIGLLEKMIQLKPEDLASRMRLAAYHLDKNRPEEAEKALKAAVTALPESTDAKLALIDFYKKQDDLKQAEETLAGYIKQMPDLLELHHGMAALYVASKRLKEAKAVYKRIIDKAVELEDTNKAKTRLAALLVADKDSDQALEYIEQVLKEDPKNKQALLIRAAISLENDEADKGIADLRILLRDDPGHVKGLRLKARAHLKKREIALARQSLEDAIQAQPQEAAANFELVQILVQTGELDNAVTVLEKMLRFAPDHIGVMQGIAKIREKQQQWDALMDAANMLKQKHPENPLGDYYLGLALQGQKRYSASAVAFEQSLKKSPKAVEPLVALAKSFVAMGKPEEALARTRRVIEQSPKHFLAVNLEGEIHLSQKQLEKAEDAFNRAITIKPEWAIPYKNLAKIRMIEKKQEAAISLLKQGYSKSGDLSLGLDLASILERIGRMEEAIAQYRDLLQRKPGNPVASNNLAMILVRGKPDQVALDQALKLVDGFEISDNAVLLDTLGWIYYVRGDLDKAVSVLERAERGETKLPEISYHLGMAYFKTERVEEAKRKLRKAVASGAQFEGVEEAKEVLERIKGDGDST
ncbi:MAG: tetratricopeptide repeat protein [Sedimenticola sp.]